MPRSHPASERQPRAKVDPNSPFAKLLELRDLLEGQANKRPWRGATIVEGIGSRESP
jgi:hypothetical protein